MNKKVLAFYKVPLVISLVVMVMVLALGDARLPVEMAGVILGALLGTFVLDFEYVLYAYILEPDKDFSKTLLGHFKNKELAHAITYIQYHKEEVQEKSLNSALFQIVIGFVAIFVIAATQVLFAQALVLTIFAQSIYKLMEHYYANKIDEWFWLFKNKPNKQQVTLYILSMLALFGVCLYFF